MERERISSKLGWIWKRRRRIGFGVRTAEPIQNRKKRGMYHTLQCPLARACEVVCKLIFRQWLSWRPVQQLVAGLVQEKVLPGLDIPGHVSRHDLSQYAHSKTL
jgi:hypothetical protein